MKLAIQLQNSVENQVQAEAGGRVRGTSYLVHWGRNEENWLELYYGDFFYFFNHRFFNCIVTGRIDKSLLEIRKIILIPGILYRPNSKGSSRKNKIAPIFFLKIYLESTDLGFSCICASLQHFSKLLATFYLCKLERI